jgi:ABC-type dipeptide/oligopeptide/nickel transport system permease subunit
MWRIGCRGPLFLAGCTLLIGFAFVAALAPLLAPYDPRLPVGPPLAWPTRAHPLGTNDLGQDILSQVIHGARPTLIAAGSVTALATLLSWLVGLAAGFVRWAEGPLMAATDLLLAMPNIPLYLLVLTLLGPSQRNLILVLALLAWPAFARIVRSLVLRSRSATYVEASRMLGASDMHTLRVHLLPATLAVMPANLVLTARFAIAAEATLAFLGLSGGTLSWGTMLSWSFADPLLFLRPVWPWLVLPPTLAIVLLILAVTWVAGGLAGGFTPRPRLLAPLVPDASRGTREWSPRRTPGRDPSAHAAPDPRSRAPRLRKAGDRP